MDTTFDQRDRKFIQIAHKNINGNAIFATSKLNHTTHKRDAVIHDPTFAHKITDNADVKDKIQVQTNAKTNTDTTFELCNSIVIKIPLQNDFIFDEVNFFNKFLNHQLLKDETDCSR